MTISPEIAVLLFFVVLFGSLAKAVTGFGLPLIAVPVTAAFLGVEAAVVILTVPSTVSNVWLLWVHRHNAKLFPNMKLTIIAGIVGVAAGTWVLSSLDEQKLYLLLALWIAFYLLWLMVGGKVRLSVKNGDRWFPSITLVAGVSQGATGVAGPFIATYVHAMGLAPSAFVFAVSVVFLVFGVGQFVSYTAFGLFTVERLLWGLAAVVPMALGTPFGIWIGRKINVRVFNACVITLLVAMFVQLGAKGLGL